MGGNSNKKSQPDSSGIFSDKAPVPPIAPVNQAIRGTNGRIKGCFRIISLISPYEEKPPKGGRSSRSSHAGESAHEQPKRNTSGSNEPTGIHS